MKRFISGIAFFVFACSFAVHAQEFSYGLNVGLNFSSFSGPKENDSAGAALEEFKSNTGFHVGIAVGAAFNDQFGIRASLLFSQKGGEYRYSGEGFQFLAGNSGERVVATGNRKVILDITNSYIDIPVTAYVRLAERFEFFGGPSFGFLVGSTAQGELDFSGLSAIDKAPVEFISALDIDYFDDTPPTLESLRNSEMPFEITADGETIYVPKTMGGYYDFTEKDKSVFNIFDLGLVGGFNYYLNRSLYLGVSVHYGLSDISNETYDVSHLTFEGTDYVKRDDKDKNFSVQASIGFSF